MKLRSCKCFLVVLFLVLSASFTQAQTLLASPSSTSLAPPGYSGLGITPSAVPLNWGVMSSAYDTAVPGASYSKGHNYLFGAGILPGIEITGRLATNDHNCNLYGIGSVCPSGSYRDLSASAKVGGQLEIAKRTWISASAGMTDFGGAATNFRSYYGVAGLSQTWWSATAGYAKAVSPNAPLHGLFGHVSVKPWEHWQLYAERVGPRTWIGSRLETKWGEGGKNIAYVAINKALQSDAFTPRQWWSIGLSIPFEQPSNAAQAKTEVPALANPQDFPKQEIKISQWTPIETRTEVKSSSEIEPMAQTAALLAHALAKAGFESISVGQDLNGPVVQLENYSYNWNQLDALGVAMGVLTQKVFDWPKTRLQIVRHGLPIYLAVGKPSCMFSWLAQTD